MIFNMLMEMRNCKITERQPSVKKASTHDPNLLFLPDFWLDLYRTVDVGLISKYN